MGVNENAAGTKMDLSLGKKKGKTTAAAAWCHHFQGLKRARGELENKQTSFFFLFLFIPLTDVRFP